jgi:hypothetical protein
MRQHVAIAVTLFALAATALSAQTPRPVLQAGNTLLLSAYKCQADQLQQADKLMNDLAAPVLNKHVAAGRLLSWGYMGVYMGGEANRHIYVWAADPAALIQARVAYLPEIQANPKFAEFARICGSPDTTLHNLITLSPPPSR